MYSNNTRVCYGGTFPYTEFRIIYLFVLCLVCTYLLQFNTCYLNVCYFSMSNENGLYLRDNFFRDSNV